MHILFRYTEYTRAKYRMHIVSRIIYAREFEHLNCVYGLWLAACVSIITRVYYKRRYKPKIMIGQIQ